MGLVLAPGFSLCHNRPPLPQQKYPPRTGPLRMSLLLLSDTSGLPRINCLNILEAGISLDADGLLSFRIKTRLYFSPPFPTSFLGVKLVYPCNSVCAE